jgi:hypothetical protein
MASVLVVSVVSWRPRTRRSSGSQESTAGGRRAWIQQRGRRASRVESTARVSRVESTEVASRVESTAGVQRFNKQVARRRRGQCQRQQPDGTRDGASDTRHTRRCTRSREARTVVCVVLLL